MSGKAAKRRKVEDGPALIGADGKPMARGASTLGTGSICSVISSGNQGSACLGTACHAYVSDTNDPDAPIDPMSGCRWMRGLAGLEYLVNQLPDLLQNMAAGVSDLVDVAEHQGLLSPQAELPEPEPEVAEPAAEPSAVPVE